MACSWRHAGAGLARPPGLLREVIIFSGVGLAVVVAGLIAAGVATKQLDIQVITEGPKSFRYRLEYWKRGYEGDHRRHPAVCSGGGGTRRGPPGISWSGVGPANFATPYLRHKLPEASEEIKDTQHGPGGLEGRRPASSPCSRLASIGIGLREMLGPARRAAGEGRDDLAKPAQALTTHSGWLLGLAGLGWLAVWALGKLNPVTQADLLAHAG